MYEYISVDPQICHGQACIKGTRIPVHQVLGMLASGDTPAQIIEDFQVTELQVYACLAYAASLAEESIVPVDLKTGEQRKNSYTYFTNLRTTLF